MEAGTHQKLKFLYLMKIFEEETDENHTLTVYELMDKLKAEGINANRKTLLEDIALLRDYGEDIISVQVGKKLGYYLGARKFELPEIKLLADAVSSARFITEKKSRQLLKKLVSLGGKYHGQEINRRVHVANRIKSENELIYISIDSIQQAMDMKRRISFRYFDRTVGRGKKYREGGRSCSPYALAWNDGNYYLVGKQDKYDHLSNFRVDRMENVQILDEKAEAVPEDFDLTDYLNTTFSMFSGRVCTVTLRFDESLVNAAADKFGTDTVMVPDGKGHFDISVKAAPAPAFYGWIFQFGEKAEIISPPEIHEEFRAMLGSVGSMYGKKK